MTLTLALRMEGDNTGLVGTVRVSREELQRLGVTAEGTGQASTRAAGQLDGVARAAQRVSATGTEAARTTRQVADQSRQAAVETANLARGQANAATSARDMATGLGAVREVARSVPGTTNALRQQARAVNDNSQALQAANRNVRQFNNGIQQAGFQVGDFFVQVASGQSPMRAFIQQGTQLIQVFGPLGSVLGAFGAILGAVYIAMGQAGDEAGDLRDEITALAAEARDASVGIAEMTDKIDSLSGVGRGLFAVTLANNLLQIRKELPEINAGLDRAGAALRSQLADDGRVEAFAEHVGANAEQLREWARAGTELSSSSTAAEINDVADATARFIALNPGAIEKMGGAFEGMFARLQNAATAKGALEVLQEYLDRTRRAAEDGVDPVQSFIAALDSSVEVYRLEGEERARREAADKAEIDFRRKHKAATDEQVEAIRRAAAAAAAEKDAIDNARDAREAASRQLDRYFDQQDRLGTLRADALTDLEIEREYQEQLTRALREGGDAVDDVRDAYEAMKVLRRLEIDTASDQAREYIELVTAINGMERANRDLERSQRDQQQAAERAANAVAKTWGDALGEVGDLFTSTMDGTIETLGDFVDTFLGTIQRLALRLLEQELIIPVVAQAAGSFGIPTQALTGANDNGGVAGSIFGGGGGVNPLSLVGDLLGGGPGGLAQSFALSGVGQTLGLSSAPVFGLGASAAGGVGAGAAAGGAAGNLTSAGAALVSAAPFLAVAAAALPLLLGAFGGQPSSGPVGIADFSPGLGRDLAFGPNEQNPLEFLTADNGGNPEGMRAIAETITDTIFDLVDRFMGELDRSVRFRIANYENPEGGNADSRVQGFEVNAFIRDGVEQRIAEGLSEQEAVLQATLFAVREAIDFQSDTLDEIARNTDPDSLEELIGDLDFGRQMDALRDAVAENSGIVDASTLATVQQTLAIEDQARETAEALVQPVLDFMDRALRLFPSLVAQEAADGPAIPSGALDLVNPDLPAIERDEGTFLAQPGYTFRPSNDEFASDGLGTISTPGGDFSLVQTGSDNAPGARNFSVLDEAGETVATFESVAAALANANEIAQAYVASQDAVNAALTPEEQARHDANRERVNLAIRTAQQQLATMFDGITGTAEDLTFGPFQTRLVEGTAQIEATAGALEEFNDYLRDAYEAFPQLSDELGPLADQIVDVAGTISDQTAQLANAVRSDFERELDRELNSLSGRGVLNDLDDLVEQRDQRARDAAAIGSDAELVDRNFEAAVEAAFEGLDLDVLEAVKENIADPTIQALASAAIDAAATAAAGAAAAAARQAQEELTAFGEGIGDRLLGFTAPGLQQLVQLNRRFEADLAFANDNGGDAQSVRDLYRLEAEVLARDGQTLSEVLADTIAGFERLAPSLGRFRQTLNVDANLSTGTALERYASARTYFEDVTRRALAGDVDAAGEIETAGRSFLELSRVVNAANDTYSADYARVTGVVDETISLAQNEIDIARDQLTALGGIDEHLAGILSALNGEGGNPLGESPTRNAILAQASGFTGSFGGDRFQTAANENAARLGINLGGNRDLNARLAFVTGFNQDFGDGRFDNYARTANEVQKEAARILLRLAGESVNFYGGGRVANGLRSRDSVFAELARDEFVINNRAAARVGVPALSYINDRGELPPAAAGSDAPAIRAAADQIVAAIHQDGNASRAQSRDDADHVAGRVQDLAGTMRAGGGAAAHERARPGRAA